MTRRKGSIAVLALGAMLIAPLLGCHQSRRDRESRYDGQRRYEELAADQRRRDEAERRRIEESRRRDRDRGTWYRHD
jgi:hypothetical protein